MAARARARAPGSRARAQKDACELLGAVDAPSVDGRAVEVVLPTPRQFAAINAAFAKLGVHELTFEFDGPAFHIIGESPPVPHGTAVQRLLVTIPAAATCSYFVSDPPRAIVVSRAELAKVCDPINATHRQLELFLGDDASELHAVLRSGGLSVTLSCVAAAPTAPPRVPADAVEPAADDGYTCRWSADFAGLVAPVLTNLPAGVSDTVTFVCHEGGTPATIRCETRAGSPASTPNTAEFAPSALAAAPRQVLHAVYRVSPFLAVRAIATAEHDLQFYMDNARPLVVVGAPAEELGPGLLGNTYFRLEAPLDA